MKNLKTIVISILIFIGILIIISFIVETNKCECKWSEATYWEKSTCRNCGEVKTLFVLLRFIHLVMLDLVEHP